MKTLNELAYIAQEAITEHCAIQKKGELVFLLHMMELRGVGSVLDIGGGAGGTGWAFMQIASMVTVVHLPNGNFGSGLPPLVDHGYRIIEGDSHSQQVWGQVHDIYKAHGPFDCVFIDGDHTYEAVFDDWIRYNYMAGTDGMVALHDIVPHPAHPGVGVQRLWHDISVPHKTECICPPDDWGGIGVATWR